LVYESGGAENSGKFVLANKQSTGWDRSEAARKGWRTREARKWEAVREAVTREDNQRKASFRRSVQKLEEFGFDYTYANCDVDDGQNDAIYKFRDLLSGACIAAQKIDQGPNPLFEVFTTAADTVDTIRHQCLADKWNRSFRNKFCTYQADSPLHPFSEWYAALPEKYLLSRSQKVQTLTDNWYEWWSRRPEAYWREYNELYEYEVNKEWQQKAKEMSAGLLDCLHHQNPILREAALLTLPEVIRHPSITPGNFITPVKVLINDRDAQSAAAARRACIFLLSNQGRERHSLDCQIEKLRNIFKMRYQSSLHEPQG
jgi:hypothetical protein